MTGATLFRTNGPAWRFEKPSEFDSLKHKTRYGSEYKIVSRLQEDKPLVILCWNDVVWVDATERIGAEYIQFDDGSEFWFRRPSE